MEDLLFAILELIAELVLQALLESALGILVSLLIRMNKRALLFTLRLGPARAFVLFSLLGVCIGILDVLIWPHRLTHTRLHGVSLLISPLIAGFVMSGLGRSLRRLEKRSIPLETFWLGFAFALAMALVRFVWVK